MDVSCSTNGKLKLVATNEIEAFYLRWLAKQGTVTLHEMKEDGNTILCFHEKVPHDRTDGARERSIKTRVKRKQKGNGRDLSEPIGISQSAIGEGNIQSAS